MPTGRPPPIPAPRERSARRPGAASAARGSGKRWSQEVAARSDALDLEPGTFTHASADAIAQALKRAAERSTRRKGTPFQSAMSMLNFYINRAGAKLPGDRRATLELAKQKLREAFGRHA